MSATDPISEQQGQAFMDVHEPFRLLLETLPHMAFVIWPEGRAAYYNQVFVDYLGSYPGPDTASRTALQHPEDRPILEAARKAGVAEARDYIVEARIQRHDGAWRWHRIHNKPLTRNGKPIAWLGTAVDIHDFRETNDALEARVREHTAKLEAANRLLTAEVRQRRQAEEILRESETKYRTLYNRTPIALHSVDTSARLIDVNDTWLSLFGYDRDDVIGRSPSEFMTPESADKYQQIAWPEMLAGAKSVGVFDYQFLTRSGRVFDGRLAARGEVDAAGRFVRSWSAIADVTAEKRADQELRQAQRLEVVSQLTAGMAHDFNNLLTAVLGNLELLAKRLPDAEPRIAALLTGATVAARRGATLTAQLLAFARQQRIVPEPIDVKHIIERTGPLLQSTTGAAIDIDIVEEPGLWTAIADPTQLELAIMNLVINARDAMPEGGMITIRLANVSRGTPVEPEEPAAGDYVSISVADTGMGMSDEVRGRVFEPFFTTKGAGKGSGLGLSQVLGMAKQLNGGVTLASVRGVGTCVTILLPKAEADLADPEGAPASGSAGVGERIRILVVDDDAGVRTVAASILRDAGHDVTEAASGAAALRSLTESTGPGDLLLTDVVMPGMNGVELASLARRDWPGLPVLFMTAYADSGLLPADVNDSIVRKPFQADELELVVQRVMARARAARAVMQPE